tara:strand:- start:24 stop:3764 length:3741 start_codon:yes stop_codon:yes gene_type:complete
LILNNCIYKYYLIIILSFGAFNLNAAEKVEKSNTSIPSFNSSSSPNSFGKVGDWGFPTNPMNDRAKGYLLKGKAQAAITNYGRFIDWDYHPAGLWGNYTYLPAVAFMAGVPGHSYSSNYSWINFDENPACPEADGDYVIWCSNDAYFDNSNSNPNLSWCEDAGCSNQNFVDVVFDTQEDRGILGEELISPGSANQNQIPCDFSDINQFCLDDLNNKLLISLPLSDLVTVNPNNSNVYGSNISPKGVGLVHPWAKRPALDEHNPGSYDLYKYGEDNEEWTNDDIYEYYGATMSESWFTRFSPSWNTDWHATWDSKENTHNTLVNEDDLFSDINYLDPEGFPLLAHSDNSNTWPTAYNDEGNLVPKWPGTYADAYSPEETGCWPQQRWNDDCWVLTDRFISDTDVYMEFDDRWAHRGNRSENNEYHEGRGYPLGLKVMATAHSYAVSFAEDIIFVTLKVRNESGDNWCAFERDRSQNKEYVTDSDGNLICGDAMVMPDGTKLNNGQGFTYRDVSMGFYMDADVVTANKFGSTGIHTNNDDFMEYYDCKNPDIVPEGCEVMNGDTLRVSIAEIYDYDFYGNTIDVGIVATQLLDSPYATESVDLNGDGFADLYPGDKLKMTDWHWFDWYNRPGVVQREGDAGCCAGDPGSEQARNKEEIQYKVMSGDTTNLSADEKFWFFHTATPSTDLPQDLNPHFDSLEGLAQTDFFTTTPDGLDCVLMMSSGPFTLEVGEQAPFSFCIIWGEDKEDLISNATFAQLMYNSHYQGYNAPDTPNVSATFGDDNVSNNFDGSDQHHLIEIHWDNNAEISNDVVTGYSDFEGYNIYKSLDGGETWGDPATDLYDVNDPDSWRPYAQYHLTSEQDINHCTFSNDYHGECSISVPQYYVKNDCYDGCLEAQCDLNIYCNVCKQNCHGDLDCEIVCKNEFNAEYENCKDGAWTACVSACNDQISQETHLNLSDASQNTYSPVFGIVDCDDSLYGGDEDGEPDIRGYNICGYDPHNLIKGENALGDCNATEVVGCCSHDSSRFCDDNLDCPLVFNPTSEQDYSECVLDCEKEIGIRYSFVDDNVIDGYEYTYAVTAFDMGIAPAENEVFIPELGINQTSPNSANPLQFAAPDGYASIETGIGRNENDKNLVKVVSGARPTQGISNDIKVVPNPYIMHSGFNETEFVRSIRFTHLPQKCSIHIYTVSGEKVNTLNYESVDDGNLFWDLRTINNQEVAPGLYVFAVENKTPGYEHEKFIGKFVIIR